MLLRTVLAVSLGLCAAAQDPKPDYAKLLGQAKLTLAEAITKGLEVAGSGVVIKAELEEDKGRVVYSLDIAQGTKTLEVLLDPADGKVLEKVSEEEDHSDVAKAARLALGQAVASAVGDTKGKAVLAYLALQGGTPRALVSVVKNGEISQWAFEAGSGDQAAKGVQDQERPFTDTFGEDLRDLASTGANPYFILEPGYVLELKGNEKDAEVTITITVLAETKKIEGIETRVVEERETVGGRLKEITRDYFAISKRTGNVYYFGEDVDVYGKDGKVVSHEGSWLSGEKGARYGLLMPAVPLLGARYYQEVAPGVGMDRAEVLSVNEKLECPAGKFENVLKTEETSPLEPAARDHKRYARGVGLIQDGATRLVKYGRSKQ